MTHPFDKSNALNEYFTSISTLDNESEHPDIPTLSPCAVADSRGGFGDFSPPPPVK